MNEITRFDQKLPAAAKQLDLRPFDRFGDDALEIGRRVQRAAAALQNLHPDRCSERDIDDGEKTLADLTGAEARALLDQHRANLNLFDPPAARDKDGEITVGAASVAVAALVGAFPNVNAHDPVTFTRVLIAEVVAVRPTMIELETAVRALRRTMKFMPTIAEALAAIAEAKYTWSRRAEALAKVEPMATKLREHLPVAREGLRRRREEDERNRQRGLPPAIGDRVEHKAFGWNNPDQTDYGFGTVVVPAADDRRKSLVTVDFDEWGEVRVIRCELKRLLPDDAGYRSAPREASV